jgi:hypothetical protein
MKRQCRSYQNDLGRMNQAMTARFRARWWRRQRRKWRQDIRAALPRLDVWGLS